MIHRERPVARGDRSTWPTQRLRVYESTAVVSRPAPAPVFTEVFELRRVVRRDRLWRGVVVLVALGAALGGAAFCLHVPEPVEVPGPVPVVSVVPAETVEALPSFPVKPRKRAARDPLGERQ